MSILDDEDIQINNLDKQVFLDYAFNKFPTYKKGGYDIFGRKLNKGDYVIFYPIARNDKILKIGVIKNTTKTGATITSRDNNYSYNNQKNNFSIDNISIKDNTHDSSIAGYRIFLIGNEEQFINFIKSLNYEYIR